MQYVVEDCFFFQPMNGWVASVSTTVADAEAFPIKPGDVLAGGEKVLQIDLYTLSFNWQATNRRGVALLLDRQVPRWAVIEKAQGGSDGEGSVLPPLPAAAADPDRGTVAGVVDP